jgi:hypothetical protein
MQHRVPANCPVARSFEALDVRYADKARAARHTLIGTLAADQVGGTSSGLEGRRL